MPLHELKFWLRAAWDRETSSDEQRWTDANPAWGQCAVTACLVQDELGGDIIWSEAQLPDGSRISHYFNRIDGLVVDLTREQFPEGTLVPAGIEKRKTFDSTRDYVLSFEATRNRYAILRRRFDRLRVVREP